jgi:BirA family biotin operon repressor/biotin-[acetyl-CoA-carboxylase] ligase
MSYYRLKPLFIKLDETSSTNSFAAELLKTKPAENGTTVLTQAQTSGKGQRGNSWISQPWKNLTCSVIYYPTITADKMFYLNIITSLAVADVLEKIGCKKIQIKWPNDILIDKKKIAGILIENQIKGSKIQCSIIGVGLNINQTEFPQEINATSIQLELGNSCDVQEILTDLHRSLDHFVRYLEKGEFNLLKEKYYERLFGLNEETRFRDSTGEFEGKITGISEPGNLIIQKKNTGEIHSYDLKEIQFLIQAE